MTLTSMDAAYPLPPPTPQKIVNGFTMISGSSLERIEGQLTPVAPPPRGNATAYHSKYYR